MWKWEEVLSFKRFNIIRIRPTSIRVLFLVQLLEDFNLNQIKEAYWEKILQIIQKHHSTRHLQELLIRLNLLLDLRSRKEIRDKLSKIRKISVSKKKILHTVLTLPNRDSLTWKKCKKWVKTLDLEVMITWTTQPRLLVQQWQLQSTMLWTQFPQLEEVFSIRGLLTATQAPNRLRFTQESSQQSEPPCSKILQAERISSTIFLRTAIIRSLWKIWGLELTLNPSLHF